MLERSRDAVILCESSARPMFMNQRAADLIAEGDGLSLGTGGVLTGSAQISKLLREAINAAGEETLKLTVPRRSGRAPLVLSITAMSGVGEAARSGANRCVAVFIQTPDRTTAADSTMLGEVFRLTRREAQVASMLASGHTLPAIAEHFNLGVGTVRSHLKQAFAKTGARNQAALVSLLHNCTDAWS